MGLLIQAKPHFCEIGRKAGFFIGAYSRLVARIDRESDFGKASLARPVEQGVEKNPVQAPSAERFLHEHETEKGVPVG